MDIFSNINYQELRKKTRKGNVQDKSSQKGNERWIKSPCSS